MEDFLAAWDCHDPERLQSLMTHVYTALRQLRDGDKKWRSMEFLRCVAVLLERIRDGREETKFPLAIHAAGTQSIPLIHVSLTACFSIIAFAGNFRHRGIDTTHLSDHLPQMLRQIFPSVRPSFRNACPTPLFRGP
jgi:hypothetical protein